MFIDEVEIYVRGGDGGGGCASFHREKFQPLGGPDGGDGGNGGSVILRASDSVNTLVEYTRRRHYRAGRGGSGGGNDRHGAEGKDLVLNLGYSHPINVPAPDGITYEVDAKAHTIKVMGRNRHQVGLIASEIRNLRPPEHYHGTGVRYLGEEVKLKAGKAGKTGK